MTFLQSVRLSLAGLGIGRGAPDVREGNHLRVGFDPTLGFPPCGFRLYRRPHREAHSLELPLAAMLAQPVAGPYRNAAVSGGIAVFSGSDGAPQVNANGTARFGAEDLSIAFRENPWDFDASPKVWRVQIVVRARGRVEARAYDDRPVDGPRKRLVDVKSAGTNSWFDLADFARLLEAAREGRVPLDPSVIRPAGSEDEHESGPSQPFEARRLFSAIVPDAPDLRTVSIPRIVPPRIVQQPAAPRGGPRDLARILPAAELAGRLVGGVRLVRLVLQADLISLVEISAAPGSSLVSVFYQEVQPGVGDVAPNAWMPLPLGSERPYGRIDINTLTLPVASPRPRNGSGPPACRAAAFRVPVPDVERDLPITRLEPAFVARNEDDDVLAEFRDLDALHEMYLGRAPGRPYLRALQHTLHALALVPPAQQASHRMPLAGDEGEAVEITPLGLLLASSVDARAARLLGLLAADFEAKQDVHYDYKVEGTWGNDTHQWITHDVFVGRDGRLRPPRAPAAIARVAPHRPGPVKTNVELTWTTPTEVEGTQRDRQFVSYHLHRRTRGGARVRLTELDDEGLSQPRPMPVVASTPLPGMNERPRKPQDGLKFTDKPPAYGRYDYGLQAEDLFGRRSDVTWTRNVDVPILLDPPPIPELSAFYIDTRDPAYAAGHDPQIDRALSSTGLAGFSGSALVIDFRYPAESVELLGVDLARFEISYRHERHNDVPGLLSSPAIVGQAPSSGTASVTARVDFEAATALPSPLNRFASERANGTLSRNAEHFAIVSASTQGASGARLRIRGRRDYLPSAGEAHLLIGADHPAYRDPQSDDHWSGFDVRARPGADSQRALRVAAATGEIAAPLPRQVPQARIATSRTPERRDDFDGSDLRFRVVVRDFVMPMPAGLRRFAGSVTVRAVTAQGRRSALARPAGVERCRYGAPPPLDRLGAGEFMYATRPDFNGRIGARLTWPRVPGITRFRVYRLDVKLLDPNVPRSGPDGLEASRAARAAVKLGGGARATADQYVLVTPVPVVADADPDAPNRLVWVDRFAGPRDGAWLYRVQPIDDAGVGAPWPGDSADADVIRDRCILILQRSRALLLPPSPFALEPLDRAIGIVLRAPASSGVAGFRVYRSSEIERASDIRTMTHVGGLIRFDDPRVEALIANDERPPRVRLVDTKVAAGRRYYYRFVIEDEEGNRSLPSDPIEVSARAIAPPAAPTLNLVRIGRRRARLRWTADHEEGEVRIQRRAANARTWEDLDDVWRLPTGTFGVPVRPQIVARGQTIPPRTVYRLKLRDTRGRFIYSGMVSD